jgi:SAM-dependent methyltransferase
MVNLRRLPKSGLRRFKELVKGPGGNFENFVHVESRRSQLSVLFAGVSPESFQGKSILEVGCGHGHLGAELERRGAKVISLDGRRENIRQLQKKFPGRPAYVCDVCSPELEKFGPVDIVFAFGLLYHLPDPAKFLAACSRMADTLLLESVVVDVLEPELVWIKEGLFYDQSIHGKGCRPSPSWVERELRSNGYSQVIDLCSVEENWKEMTAPAYTWRITGSGAGRRFGDPGYRRAWFASKKERPLAGGKIVL